MRLFLIASSPVYISALFCIPPPTKKSAAHVLQKCCQGPPNFCKDPGLNIRPPSCVTPAILSQIRSHTTTTTTTTKILSVFLQFFTLK
jgi:hypothetical protein